MPHFFEITLTSQITLCFTKTDEKRNFSVIWYSLKFNRKKPTRAEAKICYSNNGDFVQAAVTTFWQSKRDLLLMKEGSFRQFRSTKSLNFLNSFFKIQLWRRSINRSKNVLIEKVNILYPLLVTTYFRHLLPHAMRFLIFSGIFTLQKFIPSI